MTFAAFVAGITSSALLGIAYGAREAELGVVATILVVVLVAVRNR